MNVKRFPKPNAKAKTVESIQKVLAEIVSKFVYVASMDRILRRDDPNPLDCFTPRAFNTLLQAEYSLSLPPGFGRQQVWRPTLRDVLTYGGPEATVSRVQFAPGAEPVFEDERGERVLNLWCPPPIEPLPDWDGTPEPFVEHLRLLFDDSELAVEHVLDWIAHLVQRPGERVDHAILLTSREQGLGKSSLGDILSKLVGERHAGVLQSGAELADKFDDWILQKLLVVGHEVYERNNRDIMGRLKAKIGTARIRVNIKGGPRVEVENFARMLLFSNRADALPLEPNDRRFFVWDSQARKREPEYYARLHAYADSERGIREIYTFLLRRDISGFNPHAEPPMTEAKRWIVEACRDPFEEALERRIRDGWLFWKVGAEATFEEIRSALRDEAFHLSDVSNPYKLASALRACGVRKVTRNGRSVWLIPEPEEGAVSTDFYTDFDDPLFDD